MLQGYRTYIGIAITILSSIASIFAKDLEIDWTGIEAAITAIVGGLISLYGYYNTRRGADK